MFLVGKGVAQVGAKILANLMGNFFLFRSIYLPLCLKYRTRSEYN
jgi:hypothetical protein